VVCNKEIKFGLLLKKALSLEADFIATGHYARLRRASGRIVLLKGKDKNKDQSYFLWQLVQKQLRHILFPVGEYTKPEVRKMARQFKLSVAETPESMEICFAPAGINSFLKKYLKNKPGNIVNEEGDIIGKHEGLWFYTIGQRKGIKLPNGPYFVLDKDVKKNLLIVTQDEKDLYKKEMAAKDVNWILGKSPKLPLKVTAKIRYRHIAAPAVITKILHSKFYILKFARPQRAITPGQSIVFYLAGGKLLGGAILTK
jgi:tRNA-specific 2-thiouridylase